MKLEVKKAIIIPDGEHLGVVTNIRYRSKPFEYVDLEIEFKVDDEQIKIRAGYPQVISEKSKLGQLLMRFGEKLIEGVSIDPDDIIIGKKIKFKTKTEENAKGTFSRVDENTVRPAESLKEHQDPAEEIKIDDL